MRAQDARVLAPSQGSCDRPADPHAGSARQAAQARQATQAQCMNGHTPLPPANGADRRQGAALQEAPMNPVSNGFPQRLPPNIHGRQCECYSVPVDYYQTMGRPQERMEHRPPVEYRYSNGVELPACYEDRPPERQNPNPRNAPAYDNAEGQTMENPGVDSCEVGEERIMEKVTHGESGHGLTNGHHPEPEERRSRSTRQERERSGANHGESRHGSTNGHRPEPEERRNRSTRREQERSGTNHGRTGSRKHTRTRRRRDSSPDSSSSSLSRSRSGDRRGNHGAAGNGPDKKSTERSDKHSRDGKTRKSEMELQKIGN